VVCGLYLCTAVPRCAPQDQHIQQILGLLKPGGLGVLVLDFVSEETLPQLLNATDEEEDLVGRSLLPLPRRVSFPLLSLLPLHRLIFVNHPSAEELIIPRQRN
jgi:hypothetical protein